MPTPDGRFVRVAFSVVFLTLLGLLPSANAQGGAQDAGPVTEKNLDSATVITLSAGEPFKISVPLRPSRAVNLGAARLDITLGRTGKAVKAEPELHLLAILTEAQTSLNAGDAQLTLHGVAPEFDRSREAEYHPTDYSIHLGSGNVTNIGVPDDKLIDTDQLTKKLQALHIRLKAAISK